MEKVLKLVALLFIKNKLKQNKLSHKINQIRVKNHNVKSLISRQTEMQI